MCGKKLWGALGAPRDILMVNYSEKSLRILSGSHGQIAKVTLASGPRGSQAVYNAFEATIETHGIILG